MELLLSIVSALPCSDTAVPTPLPLPYPCVYLYHCSDTAIHLYPLLGTVWHLCCTACQHDDDDFVINVFRRQGCPHLVQGHGPIVSSRHRI